MPRHPTNTLTYLLSLLFISSAHAANPTVEHWPAWRGPRGDGASLETDIPRRWSATENIRWKTPIPGKGHSSPAVWGERIFVTTCLEKEERRELLCLDRQTGKILWQCNVLKSPLERKHRLNSFSSATPATDGQYVWVAFLQYPDMVVVCYDFQGKEIWRTSPGKLLSRHGFCSSPMLYKDLVILNGDQDAEAYLVALEKTTGKERWRVDRPNRTRSYCTPLIIEAAGKTQLVLSGSKCVTSYDPATGKQHWIIDGPTEQYVASLVYTQGVFFLTTGFPEYHLMGIRPDGTGNITRTHVLWHHADVPPREASYVPSPIAHDRYFYVVSDLGFVSCFEATTGKRLWIEKLGKHHSASPVSADGYLYFTSDEGDTYVLKAGAKFEVVQKNPLGEECYASPAISQGEIYLRGLNHLYCISQPRSGKR